MPDVHAGVGHIAGSAGAFPDRSASVKVFQIRHAWDAETTLLAGRYNAKRKTVGLAPITAQVFNDKVAERRGQVDQVTVPKQDLKCRACAKTFSSENVYNDHLKSKKHRETVLRGIKSMQVDDLMQPDGVEETKTDEATPSTSKMPEIPPNSCLFCPRSFATLEINLKHMAGNHAFYIPDESYCEDVPGLLAHLAQDIALGNICIYCGHGFGGLVTGEEKDAELVKRARKGMEAVRGHMTAKNHCRIPWDTDEQRLELSDYYNYESSYPDHKANGENGGEEEQEWEDEDGSEIDENDEVIMDYSTIRRKTRSAEEQDMDARMRVGEADFELVLPSGQRVGHRALRGVYKQNVMRE